MSTVNAKDGLAFELSPSTKETNWIDELLRKS